jgi:PIN domain nuclease of toxin-antitoxin system
LGPAASEAFDTIDAGEAQMIVPAVVLAELAMIAENRRVIGWDLDDYRRMVDAFGTSENCVLTPLTTDLVTASLRFSSIPDIFDRLIATETVALGAVMVTRDPVFPSSVETVRD